MKRYDAESYYDGHTPEYGRLVERDDGEAVLFTDCAAALAAKDAELAKLREQRDRLLLKRYVENVNALQYGMSMVDAQRIVDAEIAEEFGVRIIDGKVEEIGNG